MFHEAYFFDKIKGKSLPNLLDYYFNLHMRDKILECLIEEHIEPLKRAIQGMKKSQKEEIYPRIKKQELACSVLEEMKKWLFPLV
jgi:hypothetical protein